jgi:hypothetical protein
MLFLKKNISKLVILISFTGIILVNFSYHPWLRDGVFEYDVKSYYSYLPAAFIYGDMSLSYIDEHPELYDEIWPVKLSDGSRLIVTSCGMSILYSPFFFLAHAYASLDQQYPANGYSMPYRLAIHLSAVFYLLLGLIFLRKLLRRRYDDWIVALVILAVVIGTNLAFYSTYKAAMPHAYNFALITLFVLAVVHWYQKPSRLRSIPLGLLFGLIVLVRPSNILVLLVLLLWDIHSWRDLGNRILFFLKRFDYVLVMLVMFLIVWSPQFLYWHAITGKWIFFSYGAKDASFFWGNPQIYNILFSYRKGWFVYTPIMFLAFIGIFAMLKKQKEAFWAVLITMLINIYVQSCWWCWWFGGSFGVRVFVDYYGLMAIPLAALIDMSRNNKFTSYALLTVILLLTWYNTFQIRQYRHNAIHFWWNNKEAYWENFLKVRPTPNYWDMVIIPDYYLARKGIYQGVTPVEKRRRDLWRSYRDDYVKQLINQSRQDKKLRKHFNGDEEALKDSLFNVATNKMDSLLKNKEKEIKKHITSDKVWNKHLKKQVKQQNITYDSAYRQEFQILLNAEYRN